MATQSVQIHFKDFSAYKCIHYSVLQNVRICSTFVHWILIQFDRHFKLVVFLGIRTGTSDVMIYKYRNQSLSCLFGTKRYILGHTYQYDKLILVHTACGIYRVVPIHWACFPWYIPWSYRNVTGTKITQKVLSRCVPGIYCMSPYERFIHSIVYIRYMLVIAYSCSHGTFHLSMMSYTWYMFGIYHNI